MRIAQVSFAERAGGAERVAMELHHGFRAAGHAAALLTPRPLREAPGHPLTPGVVGIDIHARRAAPLRWLARIDHRLARPLASLRRRVGHDDLHHPWTPTLLDLADEALGGEPDVLHLHNLHGGWFDLRELAPLSRRVPTFLTLHDAAWLTGGPHFPFLTPRWPATTLTRNRALRRAVFERCRLHVVTPCGWMRGLIAGSELEPGVVDRRVIPYGVDTAGFAPGSREPGRALLGLGPDAFLVLGVALTGRGGHSHKDPATVIRALGGPTKLSRPVTLCFLGGAGPTRSCGAVTIRHHAAIHSRAALASVYRAADLLVHAAHEDNFPNAVLEAQACGLPCVVTDRGGMPEQVIDGRTGFVVPAHDATAMSAAIARLLGDDGLRRRVGLAAAAHAGERFTLERMTRAYLEAFEAADPAAESP